jgi:hypothetical protein
MEDNEIRQLRRALTTAQRRFTAALEMEECPPEEITDRARTYTAAVRRYTETLVGSCVPAIRLRTMQGSRR